jgi:acetyl esterase/lipase
MSTLTAAGIVIFALNTCVAVMADLNTPSSGNSAFQQKVSQGENKSMNIHSDSHLTEENSIGDLLRHPAFGGHGHLLLPRDERKYDASLQLKDIATLLPYHSHVDPKIVVSSLNLMIDEVGAGKTIFYDFYTPAQRQANPSLAQTGLFFLRGKPGAPFAVIAPGGGFQYVGSVHEGFPYAVQIARSGYNAFVLKYRVGSGGSKATEDLAAALTYIFKHADTLQVSKQHYSLWGSSAGARMAAAVGSHGALRFGGAALPKPAAVIMAYTGHAETGPQDPPTFVVAGERDGIAPPSIMERRVAALTKAGTRVEFHVYPNLAHGFGPATGTSAEGWIGKAIEFWINR